MIPTSKFPTNLFLLSSVFLSIHLLICLIVVLRPFKPGQVHGIHVDGRIITRLLGRLTCRYSRVGEPRTLQAAYLPASLCMAHFGALAPQSDMCHGTQQGVSTLEANKASFQPENYIT